MRHLQPIYIWLDLSLFSAESAEKPGQEDIKLLAQILESLSELKSAKLSDVEKHLKFIKSNKSEREAIVAALGYCGILHVPGYPCFYEEYILSEQREYSNYARSDWPFPADLWLPEFGVNDRSINFWFADYL